MKYMVMECGLSYAIVLDEEGRFLKVPNLGYEVGQTTEHIVLFSEIEKPKEKPFLQRHIHRFTAAAACICLVVVGSGQLLLRTYGTVRMEINPDVLLSVNRFDYVTAVDGLNADGEVLIDAYHSFGKKIDVVSDELSMLAVEMGYLEENGQIRFTVESAHEEWKEATEELLIARIPVHLPKGVDVEIVRTEDEHSVPAAQIQEAEAERTNMIVQEEQKEKPKEKPVDRPKEASPVEQKEIWLGDDDSEDDFDDDGFDEDDFDDDDFDSDDDSDDWGEDSDDDDSDDDDDDDDDSDDDDDDDSDDDDDNEDDDSDDDDDD